MDFNLFYISRHVRTWRKHCFCFCSNITWRESPIQASTSQLQFLGRPKSLWAFLCIHCLSLLHIGLGWVVIMNPFCYLHKMFIYELVKHLQVSTFRSLGFFSLAFHGIGGHPFLIVLGMVVSAADLPYSIVWYEWLFFPEYLCPESHHGKGADPPTTKTVLFCFPPITSCYSVSQWNYISYH